MESKRVFQVSIYSFHENKIEKLPMLSASLKCTFLPSPHGVHIKDVLLYLKSYQRMSLLAVMSIEKVAKTSFPGPFFKGCLQDAQGSY